MNGTYANRVSTSWLILKLTYGLVFIGAGLDKFFNILAVWAQYVERRLPSVFMTDVQTFLYAVGIIEIIIGVLILTKWTKLGAYLGSIWFFLVVGNLLMLGMFHDVAIRDTAMAFSLIALAHLTPQEKA